MEKSWCSAESGMGPLYDPWTRTSHLAVPAATTQEAKEMKLARHLSAASHSCPCFLLSLWWRDYLVFLFLTLIFKGCSIHWSARTCFLSWVEPPLPPPCQMSDFKALERSVSSRPYLPSLESMWNQIMVLQGPCEFAVVVFIIGCCIYGDLSAYISVCWKLYILSDKSLPCYKPLLKEVFIISSCGYKIVLSPCQCPLHSLWAICPPATKVML